MTPIEMTKIAVAGGTLAAVLALWAMSADAAISEGRTTAGHRYLAGGIGIEEVEALRSEAPRYSLQVITAARSGAYLAGTHVRLVGPGNDVILDTTINGPWLLVDLPAGRYGIRATHSGNTVERSVTVTSGQPQKIVLHFDVAVDHEVPASIAPSAAPPRLPQ
jgi:hypothetical protein